MIDRGRYILDQRERQHGVSVVEMCLLLPLMTMLVLGSLEIPHFLRTYQNLITLSREGASLALRDCESGTDFNGCAIASALRVRDVGTVLIPNIKSTVSLWRWNNTLVPPTCELVGISEPSYGVQSRVTPASFDNVASNVCKDQGFLAVTEVSSVRLPLLPQLAGLSSFLGGESYAISIF